MYMTLGASTDSASADFQTLRKAVERLYVAHGYPSPANAANVTDLAARLNDFSYHPGQATPWTWRQLQLLLNQNVATPAGQDDKILEDAVREMYARRGQAASSPGISTWTDRIATGASSWSAFAKQMNDTDWATYNAANPGTAASSSSVTGGIDLKWLLAGAAAFLLLGNKR